MNEFTSDQAGQGPQDERPAGQPPVSDQPPTGQNWTGQAGYQQQAGYEQLYRPLGGRMIAGVAGGIAQYLGIDVTIVRVAFAVLTVIGGAGIPVYVVGWLLMPDEATGQSIASDFIGSLQSRPN
jgi:phage shock protein C